MSLPFRLFHDNNYDIYNRVYVRMYMYSCKLLQELFPVTTTYYWTKLIFFTMVECWNGLHIYYKTLSIIMQSNLQTKGCTCNIVSRNSSIQLVCDIFIRLFQVFSTLSVRRKVKNLSFYRAKNKIQQKNPHTLLIKFIIIIWVFSSYCNKNKHIKILIFGIYGITKQV